MNFILIGMPSSGKSRVGKELAKKTGMDFFDTDAEIKGKYGEIDKIFAEKGEEFFRDAETEVALRLSSLDNAVISTGGGIIKRERNMSAFKKNGVVVYLKVSPETVMKRTLNVRRPVIGDKKSVYGLYDDRKDLYDKYADVTVDSNGYDLKKKTDAILKAIEKTSGQARKND